MYLLLLLLFSRVIVCMFFCGKYKFFRAFHKKRHQLALFFCASCIFEIEGNLYIPRVSELSVIKVQKNDKKC